MADSKEERDRRRPSVVIVQPYLPTYRVEFFDRLISELRNKGVDCVVVAAQPSNEQLARGDEATRCWVRPYRQRRITFFGKTIGLGGAREMWSNADVVIVGHLGSSADTYWAIWDAVRGRIKVGLWGHIKSYVSSGFPLDLALERWQLRRANHVFAYVPSGRDYAIENGVDGAKVTTVMNTVDTTRLAAAKQSLDEREVAEFRGNHGLSEGRVLGYIGGLDASKRIVLTPAENRARNAN